MPSSPLTAPHITLEGGPEALLQREWLVANGLGGYASATVSGACTRRYHGLLIAALPAPLGRVVMFNHLSEELKLENGEAFRLDADDPLNSESGAAGVPVLFELEAGLPVWRYRVGPFEVERRIVLPHLQNTVAIIYRVVSAPTPLRIRLRPSFHFRPHEAPVEGGATGPYEVASAGRRIEVRANQLPPLRMWMHARRNCLVLDGGRSRTIHYRWEKARGYDYEGPVWSPGYFRADLSANEEAVLVASTESWDTLEAIEPTALLDSELGRRERLLAQAPAPAREGLGAALVLAADQFIIRPGTRVADEAVAHAAGDDARTVIAGYHWFTDWGRDTMISLEGLTLSTGRHREGGYLLRTFARYVRDGLIPNLFPEGRKEGLYHTADATLWFFHALHRYTEATGDRDTMRQLLPTLRSIVDHHVRGTRFGIRVDAADGLLSQGEQGYALTWMDAKVGDWVVTPRRGKAVEINALWYDALRLLQHWLRDEGDAAEARRVSELAEQNRRSFNERFWNPEEGCLYDLVDGERGTDPAVRPNQVLAVSLDYAVLDEDRRASVVDAVKLRLLTPYGLRSLAPGHADYKATYDGDLRSRDAAYHQGTVWGWLIGPFIDAWLRVYPDRKAEARAWIDGFENHLPDGCVGSVSEIFDAEAPYHPRGCVAQAWSVAEVLRCLLKTRD